MATQSPIAPVTVTRGLTVQDLRSVLAAGWRDFMAHPQYGLFFAAFYAVGGAVLYFGLVSIGRAWWLIPVLGGFPLLAPFAAAGLYEVSRRRELGLPIKWGDILTALKGRGDEQLILMGIIGFVAFSFWMIIAHGIFAIFMGVSGFSQHSIEMLFTPQALMMLAVGSAVGAVFAAVMFAVTLTSLPMLVDKEVDFITAIIVSLGVVRCNKRVLFLWAVMIAVVLVAAMAPMFLGLFVALPVLGHATWHLYRRAVQTLS